MTNLKLKLIEFSKRHKKQIIIYILVAWLIIFIINMILKNQPEKIPAPSTTYTPHIPVMDDEQEVPKKYQQPIENLIDTYFNYCNNREYEKAYNIITDECKKKLYPTLEQFTGYVNHVFENKKKIYNIQSYSIVDNKYIYSIRILDDILANGTTDGYYYYEEKFVLTEENGQMKLSIGEYIGDKNPNITVENDNMIIEITNVSVDYETETYTIKITNKTDKYIVIADNTQDNEIVLDLGEQSRRPENMVIACFYIEPNSSESQDVVFNKLYDNGLTAKNIVLGAIRILNEYDPQKGTTTENLDNAVKLYGLKVKLN